MDQVRLGSGLGRIKVPKPRKLSVVASVCVFYLVSVCACSMPYIINTDSTALVVICAWFVRKIMWTYVPRCPQ